MKYAKAVVAIAAAGTIAAQNALPLNDIQHAWLAVAVAVLGAAAVYLTPNKPTE